jgi:hypothetical protein
MSGPDTYIYAVKGIGLSERKDPHTEIKRKAQTLLMAARHNLREIPAENGANFDKLDRTRKHLNELLAGPDKASEVVELNNRLFAAAGKDPAKMRKDHVQGSEHVLSLASGQDERGFFSVIVECFKDIYGAENILSATVHRDQEQPHIHILVSPISGGIYRGGNLHNNIRTSLNKALIAQAVKPIGFTPPPTCKVKKQQIIQKAGAVIAFFEYYQHPLLNDPAWPAWLKTISNDPNPLFDHYQLGSALTPKTLAQERLRKPIDIGADRTKVGNLSSVDIGTPPPPKAPPATAERNGASLKEEQYNHGNLGQHGADAIQTMRIRDCDLPADSYDPETGEFYNRPSARAQAHRWG